uniref:Uncharacterized protein n=1 Tax=Candidozyma auris TaxID=498019 RepID=A0A0L0NYK9_CANAR
MSHELTSVDSESAVECLFALSWCSLNLRSLHVIGGLLMEGLNAEPLVSKAKSMVNIVKKVL